MSKNQNLKIYKASAGSGKTHTIVYEYVIIALENLESFKQILAVTFTNKVARELKNRILETVQSIAKGEMGPLAREILLNKRWSEEGLIDRAKILLEIILQDYEFFQISTIDSFFQKVIGKFDVELGLEPGFTIELDSNGAKKNIVASTIDKIKVDKYLKNWLLQFAEEKLREGKSWEIERDISTICATLFTENNLLTEKKIEPEAITAFIKKLNREILNFESTIQNFGKKAIDIIRDQNIKTEDFLYGKSGVMGYLEKASNMQIENPTKRTLAALDNSSNWISKKSENKETIIALVEKYLLPLLQDFMLFYHKKSLLYKSAKSAKKFIYILGIKSEMQREIEKHKKTQNILFILDATVLTCAAIEGHAPEEFSKKFEHSYKNFFIDEFQDISHLQWKCFLPLIKNSIATKDCSIVVGDVKQSIYRWRNSDWQLLHEKIAQDIPDNEIIDLNTNWRSARNIVLFNNTFFSLAPLLINKNLAEAIAEIECMQLRNVLSQKIESLTKIYGTVAQKVPTSATEKNVGYVQINFLDTDKESGVFWQEIAIDKTIATIEELQIEGFEAKDIAVLVRNHKEGRQIFEAILKKSTSSEAKKSCNYSAVSASSFSLGQNAWVSMMLSAMKYISNPHDALARFEAFHFFKICTENKNKEKNIYTEEAFEEKFLEKIKIFYSYPLHSLVDALSNVFEIEDGETGPFFQKLKDLMIDFEKKSSSLKDFLLWWEEKGRHAALPEQIGIDAIKILTIHQSKGLQFGAVLMPFCDWDFDHSAMHAPMLWCRAETEEGLFAEAPLLPMFYSSKLKETFFAKSYYEEQMQSYLDNLNLLYVALTRAQGRMYLFSPRPIGEGLKSISDLLYATLLQNEAPGSDLLFQNWQGFWNDEKNIFTIGEKQMGDATKIKFENTATKNNIVGPSKIDEFHCSRDPLLKRAVSARGLGPSKGPFGLLFGPAKSNASPARRICNWNTNQFRRGPLVKNQEDWLPLFASAKSKFSSQEILLGDLIHKFISQMGSLGDLPKILEKINFLRVSEDEKNEVRKIFQKFSNHADMQSWFDGSWDCKVEMALFTRDGKILRPDRVLIKKDKIVVLDFKTGLGSSAHPKQIKKYIDALASMYSHVVEGWLVYLHCEGVEVFRV